MWIDFGRILVPRVDALEHRDVLTANEGRSVRLWDGHVAELFRAGIGVDGFQELLHQCTLVGFVDATQSEATDG